MFELTEDSKIYEWREYYDLSLGFRSLRVGVLAMLSTILTLPIYAQTSSSPATPSAPTVMAGPPSSLNVTWVAPQSTGSPITDYDYRYRAEEPGQSWNEVVNTEISSTEVTIADLKPATYYEVQVRATNGEGTSDWSSSGHGITAISLLSPDGQNEIVVELRNGVLYYAVARNGDPILNPSVLGIISTDNTTDEIGPLTITDTSTRESNTTWTPVWGKSSEVVDHFRELTVELQEALPQRRTLNVIFRTYDDGIAFHYSLPEQSNLTGGDNLWEHTEFNFAGDWTTYYRVDTERAPDGPLLLSEINKPKQPMVFLPNPNLRLALLDAAVLDYQTMSLLPGTNGTHSLRVNDTPVTPISFETPFTTPWRVLLIAPDFSGLLETRLLETLSPPSRIADPSFIQPGTALWDRRIRKLTYGGLQYWLNTRTYIHMLDFAAANDIPYLLIDSNWYGNQRSSGSNPLTADPQINIDEILEHAEDNGVKLLLYVNDLAFANHDMDTVFETYQGWGVAGVKYGFLKADGVEKVRKTIAAIESAARHSLLINFHDNPLPPNGLHRTYPNLITVEFCHAQIDAVRAFTPSDFLRTAFVHMLAGPLDMNNGFFALETITDRTNGGLDYSKRLPPIYATVATELARLLIIDTGLRVLPDAPEEYAEKDDLFEFARKLPSGAWYETRVLHAEIGGYLSTARRDGRQWFIGSVINEAGGSLDIDLDFLEDGVTYAATLYEDAETGHYQNDRESYNVRQTTVTASDTITATMAPGGGHALWLRPETQPVFVSAAAFEVTENESVVGSVEAVESGSKYRITGYAITGGTDQNQFKLTGAGTLSFKTVPNFEHPTDIASTTPPNTAGNNEYIVVVTATSNTGTLAAQTLTITVTDENEAPVFPAASATRTLVEDTPAGQALGLPLTATDDDRNPLTYALDPVSDTFFTINPTSGQLRTKAELNYETQPTYLVTVTATDDAEPPATATIDVTITVTDAPGTVTLSPTQPRVDTELTATLSDPDDVLSVSTWAWEWSEDGSVWSLIDGATTGVYTPRAADVGHSLRATATYTDGDETTGKEALGVAAALVSDRPQSLPPRPPGGGPPSGGGPPGGGGAACTQEDVHGNTATQATEITLATVTAGAICPAGDVDYLTVTAPGRGLLFVDTTGRVQTRRTLWQHDEVMASGSTGRQPDARLGARVQAGPVVVALQGQGGATGEYDVVVTFVRGYLENPGAESFQSGVGVLSGWVCDAEVVEIELNGVPQQAAYGTERLDTLRVCGDTDNGFGLLFNWNLLSDGEHEVVALVDGVELGRATVTVTTLGAEFLRGAEGECTAEDFSTLGKHVTLVWQQTSQNFVIAGGSAPSGTVPGRPSTLTGYLENPGPHSFQSGVGVISGWVCDADTVELEIGAAGRQGAAYGTERADTLAVCGDTDNGFGLLFNWNLLGEGEHEVVAYVDDVELGRATVRVTTLGQEFLRGAEGECVVEDFPMPGEKVTLEWQQSSQNFVITDVE